jgi:hypothetical protein
MRYPCDDPRQGEVARLENAVVQTQAGDGAEVLVEVIAREFSAQHRHEVLREQLRLPHGVLCVRNAVAADAAAGQVGNGRDIAC